MSQTGPEIIIRDIASEYVNFCSSSFNVNNIWPDNLRPSNYREVINQFNTDNWIHFIHKNIETITIDMKKNRWIIEAARIGYITGRVPKGYEEEFSSIEQTYSLPPTSQGWFIRSKYNSPKYGCHGTGPYYTIKQIVESIITTKCTHRLVEDDDNECILYLLPWITNFDIDKEFRVFVYNNEITAISCQYIYARNDWVCGMTDVQRKKLVLNLIRYFGENIKGKLSFLQSYVMDIYMVTETEWYFIEPNPFGGQYPSGSALFHWVRDNDKLTNSSKIEFYYVS